MTEETPLEALSEHSAIRRIEQLAVAAGKLPPDYAGGAVILPEGSTVESLEHLQDEPNRQRLRYTTERIDDYVRYVNDEAGDGRGAVVIRSNGSGADGWIDFGHDASPGWREHRAELRMHHSPELQALIEASKAALSQRALMDWIEDWAHIITPTRDNEPMPLPKALAAIRKVDITASAKKTSEERDLGATRSSIEEIEARAAKGELPGTFLVRASVYPQTTEREITARLTLRTGGEEPTFRLRIMGEAALVQETADEVVALVQSGLSERVRTYVGTVAA